MILTVCFKGFGRELLNWGEVALEEGIRVLEMSAVCVEKGRM